MIIGFTGTQRGLSLYQKGQLATLFYAKRSIYGDVEFHHGQCIGADFQAFRLASFFDFWTVSHPPTNQSKIFHEESDETLCAYPYLERNRHIVDACDVLVATPGERTEQLRSGTWSTWRYAVSRNKEIELILP